MKKLTFVFFLSMFCVFKAYSQEEVIDYNEATNYEIGSIRVIGNKFTDAQALISITGLKVGDIIRFPGDDIPNVIKNLWKLRLFNDIQIDIEDKIGDVLKLVITVQELPRLANYSYTGIKKNKHSELNNAVAQHLSKGSIVTENVKMNASTAIKGHFIKKGFLDVSVIVTEKKDSIVENALQLTFKIEKGDKVKIDDILFTGNEHVKTGKLKKIMANTNSKINPLKTSKFVQEDYETDKEAVLAYYNTLGYRDAKIKKDTIFRITNEENNNENMVVSIEIEEGKPYYFGNIKWKGNSIYTNEQLTEVLGIRAGDIYNNDLLQARLNFSEDGRDINSLYMDNGYLFFRIKPVEISINSDTIDLEIRLFEGAQAEIGNVVIQGNHKTKEHVIRRELRTEPGDKFSRADIIRSQREFISLGYFNPESLGISTPVNEQNGKVDIVYTVEEKQSDKLEFSAGWQGTNRLVGTAGIVFNNFSAKNIFNKEAWKPLPMGDGQTLSIRAATNGVQFQSINASFTEPWLGGKKANALSIGGYYNRNTNGALKDGSNYESLVVSGFSAGIGTRLKWPDDYFVSNTTLSFQNLRLTDYSGFSLDDGTSVSNGSFNNISITQTFSRNSIDQPIFPTKGFKLSVSGQFTPPYSLFNNKNHEDLPVEERFKFVEYQKINLKAEWYTKLSGKFVLKSYAKVGLLGQYSGSNKGLSPFERFELGGNGLNSGGGVQQGKDFISARGYDVGDYEANNEMNGTAAFNKFGMELRYPFSLNPSMTFYGLAFIEGSNAYGSVKDYNPFDLKRSAGIGLRAFLPMFGTLGFDYSFGIDKDLNPGAKWSEYGSFNIVLGFEPE